MKKVIISLFLSLIAVGMINSQSPQSFSYQAVVRNSSGVVLPNQNVGLFISILKGSTSGSVVYEETHTAATNDFGLINLQIGNGNVQSGVFSAIAWGDDKYFVSISLDPAGGANYQLMGTTQLLSVPYALYSLKSGMTDSTLWEKTGNDIYYNAGNVGIGDNAPAGRLVVKSDATAGQNDDIFSVLNANGDTVLAVYQEGVRIWVADDTSGSKATGSRGGFAVGGFNPSKTLTNEYLRVTPDSVRVYIQEDYGSKATGSRGGFAVGGFSPSKGLTDDYLYVNDDSTRIWTSDPLKGFGVKNIGLSAKQSYMLMTPENYFIGHQTGNSITSGLYNVFIGYEAGMNNTSGNYNYFMGYRAGYNTSSGYSNMFFGDSCGFANTTGYWNTAFGYKAMKAVTTGWNNTAVGVYALYKNTGGDYNTGIGLDALYSNTTGNSNTAIGFNALLGLNGGNYNTAIGNSAYSSGTYYYSSALGYNTSITASYQIRLGHSGITSIGGQVAWTALSDGRFKKDITNNVPGLDFILKLEPVTYHTDLGALSEFLHTPDSLRDFEIERERGLTLQTGFIAQDVERAANELGYEFSGVDKPKNENDYYGLRYAEFTVPLVKSVQELNEKNELLELENANLKTELELIKKRLELLENQMNK
ncbi:MAG: tail fiber domain-containing protein [Bacteroidota bacterium]